MTKSVLFGLTLAALLAACSKKEDVVIYLPDGETPTTAAETE